MSERHGAPYDHHVAWSMCPHCGALQDGAANMTSEHAPEEGDVCICFECGRWCEFDDKGGRRKLTPEKVEEVMKDPRIRHANRTYWEFRSMHPERWPNG